MLKKSELLLGLTDKGLCQVFSGYVQAMCNPENAKDASLLENFQMTMAIVQMRGIHCREDCKVTLAAHENKLALIADTKKVNEFWPKYLPHDLQNAYHELNSVSCTPFC